MEDLNFTDNGEPLSADSNAPQQQRTEYVQIHATLRTFSSEMQRTYASDIWCVVGTNDWVMWGTFNRRGDLLYRFNGRELSELLFEAGLHAPAKKSSYNGITTECEETPQGAFLHIRTDSLDGNPAGRGEVSDRLSLAGRIAWLAFCSGPVLRQNSPALQPMDDIWKELMPETQFVSKAVLLTNKFIMPRVLDLELATGQPVMQYRATAFTNVLGWEFPLQFKMVHHRPRGTNGWEFDFGEVLSIGPAPTNPAAIEAQFRNRTPAVALNAGKRDSL